MTAPPERLLKAKQWIQKAENDWCNASHTLGIKPEDCPYDTICYHAQQCVEKYLKAWLVLLGTDFPKTHDINTLVSLLPVDHGLSLTTFEQETLTDYAVVSRYPEDSSVLGIVEATQAMDIAKRIREVIRTKFPPEILS